MTAKPLALAFSAVALSLSMACVTKVPAAHCNVTGVKHLSAGTSADEICRTFDRRLEDALEAGGKPGAADTLRVDIDLTERGSATAQVTGGDAGEDAYPLVAVDVMDRALMPSDLDRLADAVAQMLMN